MKPDAVIIDSLDETKTIRKMKFVTLWPNVMILENIKQRYYYRSLFNNVINIPG